MDTIKLYNKRTHKIGEYDIFLGIIPQTICVEIKGGEGRSYSSIAAILEDYEILNEEEEK